MATPDNVIQFCQTGKQNVSNALFPIKGQWEAGTWISKS